MTKNTDTNSLSYKDAGVDIDAGNELVKRIKGVVSQTKRSEVIGGLGGFGALCRIPEGYNKPVLVSGTDGVGTKLRLAMDLNRHEGIGIDLVAMCVNDLIVAGAEPLFFLDYYATGKLNVDIAAKVIEGIAKGCKLSGAALVGGETAEMPGMYQNEDYDLAGFCTGIVEEDNIIDGSKVKSGDILLGLASSGAHSNGYSLIRKILNLNNTNLNEQLGNCSIADALMVPTRIYVKSILELIKHYEVHALSHITGGGLLENIPRVLPQGTKAIIDSSSWETPKIFKWLQNKGEINSHEMYRTFNNGVGMVICIPTSQRDDALQLLKNQGETAWELGEIVSSDEQSPSVELINQGN